MLRSAEKRLDQSLDVESRSPDDDHRPLFDLAGTLDPLPCLVRPSRRGVSFGRFDDIDPVMCDAGALVSRRFGSSNIELAIDLARIRADDGRVVCLAKLQSELGSIGVQTSVSD